MDLQEPLPPGEKLTDLLEQLFRNVREEFVHEGRVSSQAFEPAPDDEGLLSVDRSSLTLAKASFELFLKRPNCLSAGVMSVTVQECEQLETPALENPLQDNAAHAVADFRDHNRSQRKKRAGKLRDLAELRGWSHEKP